jgi:hypothetical protein
MLNARNEELAQLNAYYMRRIEAASSESPMPGREKHSSERQHPVLPLQPSHTVNSSFGASSDEGADSIKSSKGQQKHAAGVFKWRGNSKEAAALASAVQDGTNEKPVRKHLFQQVSVLRLSKCDHCAEKLWGSQARCQSTFCVHCHCPRRCRTQGLCILLACHISVHPRCHQNVQVICVPQNSRREDGSTPGVLRTYNALFGSPTPCLNVLLPEPAIFGREITEQLRTDSKFNEKMVPLIVEKCIAAVDAGGGPLLLEIVSNRH